MPFFHGTSVCQDVAGELPAAPLLRRSQNLLHPISIHNNNKMKNFFEQLPLT